MARTAKITNANVGPRHNVGGNVGNTPVRAQDFNDLAGDYVSLTDANAQSITSAVTVSGAAALSSTLAVAGASTLSGALTASAGLLFGVQTVVAAGNAIGNAGLISATGGAIVNIVTADNTKGVKLPSLASVGIGAVYIICNNIAAKTLEVYPTAGDAINPASDDAPITIAADTIMLCIAVDGVSWMGAELPIVSA
jgi:hypothetical protein